MRREKFDQIVAGFEHPKGEERNYDIVAERIGDRLVIKRVGLPLPL